MDLGIRNKNVLIVGASKGIGRAIAVAFAKEGAKVTTIARSEELLIDLQKEINELNNENNKYYVSDLMEDNANALALKILEERGAFDIVVHNVGGSLVSRNALGTLEEWQYAWKFNAGIAIDMNNILIPPMIEKGWGRVVHISSISAKMLRGNPLYASSKEFLNAYVTTVGRELASKGVVMTAVMPGAVAFPGSYWDNYTHTDPARCEDFLRHHQAAGRFGTVKEIADVVLFMASEQASFMQAALIPVDGANM
ncbi:SDR family NAD(P)-dependent oxidoreductase [Aneurinibacillus tyrosinisolvens]|uniref:SDR family NAD(P)-dependent oxidoreductase n=1 Tax=Aneurinibacillus tyrosinisolvens TaxID=1443435 RepID=UPI00063EF5E7|nr:SDR family oxidoreductase [Aneurinibacillus tyrosinisolvens]